MPSGTHVDEITWTEWPQYDQAHYDAVARVIRSNRLFNGPVLKEFENAFAEFSGNSDSVGVGNATQGLHLALAALDIGLNDEVIVTPYSWISSASCVLMQNAIPVFADIEPNTFGLSLDAIKAAVTPRTKAVVLVHMFGYPADVAEIAAFCAEKNIVLVEDCSHAFGLRVDGIHVGLIGDAGVFSMQQRKPISTGDGCVIISKHRHVTEKIGRLRSFGDDELSYNYRMSEFSAGLALVGLERLPNDNHTRRRYVDVFCETVSEACLIRPLKYVSDRSTAVYYSLLLDVGDMPVDDANERTAEANTRGVPLKRTWTPLNRHPYFNPSKPPARGTPWLAPLNSGATGSEPQDFASLPLPVSEEYQLRRLYELELHPALNEDQVRGAAQIISKCFS